MISRWMAERYAETLGDLFISDDFHDEDARGMAVVIDRISPESPVAYVSGAAFTGWIGFHHLDATISIRSH